MQCFNDNVGINLLLSFVIYLSTNLILISVPRIDSKSVDTIDVALVWIYVPIIVILVSDKSW